MDGFLSILKDGHFWVLVLGYYAVMAFIGGMPAPKESDSRTYVWLYSSLHIFSANLKDAKDAFKK